MPKFRVRLAQLACKINTVIVEAPDRKTLEAALGDVLGEAHENIKPDFVLDDDGDFHTARDLGA